MDSSNQFLVGARQDGGFVVHELCTRTLRDWPPPAVLTREQALNLAAWLVAIADPGREEFDRVLHSLSQ